MGRVTKQCRALDNHHYYVLTSQFTFHALRIQFASFCKLSVHTELLNECVQFSDDVASTSLAQNWQNMHICYRDH